MRHTPTVLALTASAAITAGLTGCGAAGSVTSGSADQVGAREVGSVLAKVQAAGKPAYYLGDTVDGLPMTFLHVMEENAPVFGVDAYYGTCSPSGDGGCADPVSVSTNDRPPDLTGLHCRRLDPQLGVPAGIVMGELTLATGDVLVTVSDFRGRSDDDDGIRSALRLVPRLRALGESTARRSLPPPSAATATWMDQACGTTPGGEVSHDLDVDPVTPTGARVGSGVGAVPTDTTGTASGTVPPRPVRESARATAARLPGTALRVGTARALG